MSMNTIEAQAELIEKQNDEIERLEKELEDAVSTIQGLHDLCGEAIYDTIGGQGYEALTPYLNLQEVKI